jgi:hypothetical protein
MRQEVDIQIQVDEFEKNRMHQGYIDFLDEICKPARLTLQQLRMHSEFENISEEDGEKIIETLYELSILAYYIVTKNGVNQKTKY